MLLNYCFKNIKPEETNFVIKNFSKKLINKVINYSKNKGFR